MALLVFYFFLSVFVSFLCSAMEAFILSVSVPFIETRREKYPSVCRILKRFKEKIDRPLSAILSLNTVANTIGAAGVGAQATKVFGNEYFGLVSGILTLTILIFSEIVPKTIGATYWKKLFVPAAYIIRTMIFITYPLVLIAKGVNKVMFPRAVRNTTSREEIAVLAEMSTREGVLQEQEKNIIQNIINLKEVTAGELMTPRTVVVAAQENMTLEEFVRDPRFRSFTRIPLFTENLDDSRGYILRPSVFEQILNGKGKLRLKRLRRDFMVVYSNMSITTLWQEMLVKKEHIALVVDQFGGFDGILTMEDIIEALLGLEIVDERDTSDDMQQLARDRWEHLQKELEERSETSPE